MDNRIFIIGQDRLPEKLTLRDGQGIRWTLVALPGVSAGLSLEVDIEGEGCEADIAGLYLCKGGENVSLDMNVRHNCSGSVSRQLFRGILDGRSKVDFDGLIYVKKDAQRTKAFQECKTILLSREAVISTRPQLEIYADDVECSHGAASGFLSPDELFYMRSRGIPEDKARELQMISFISSVAAQVEDGTLREKIYDSLSEC